MEKDVTLNFVSIMKKKSIEINADLTFSQLTTLGVGGKIKLVIFPDTVKKTVYAIRLLIRKKIPFVVLGKGSNTLASDEDYDGVVVSTLKLRKTVIKGRTVIAQAGASTVNLAKLLQDKGLAGGEFLACLPASVGGATVTNAGCFGQDVKSVAVSVTALVKGKIRKLSVDKCGFGKRASVFKNNPDYVVLSVKMRFKQSTPQAVAEVISQMRAKKSSTQPLNHRSAGCVLYHDKIAVSRLIDEAGLKGLKIGGAQVSTKHAGFVINVDNAESKDIYLILRQIKDVLYARFGIVAKSEVCLINFTKDEYNDLFAGSQK